MKSPNDPKLSDRGVRRGTCTAGGKAAAEAGAVTHGAVRCSAWLGVAGFRISNAVEFMSGIWCWTHPNPLLGCATVKAENSACKNRESERAEERGDDEAQYDG